MKKKVLLLILSTLFLLSPISFAGENSDNIARSNTCVKQAKKFFEKSDLVNTEKKLKEAIQLNDKNDEAYFELGNLEAFGKVYNESLGYYTKAISINPKKSEYYLLRATAELLLIDYKSAIDDYNKSIELNPKNETAYHGLGQIYCDFGYFKEALEYLNKSIQYSDGKDDRLYALRASIKISLKDYEGAIADYKKALTLAKKRNDEQAVMFIDQKIKRLQKGMDVFK